METKRKKAVLAVTNYFTLYRSQHVEHTVECTFTSRMYQTVYTCITGSAQVFNLPKTSKMVFRA